MRLPFTAPKPKPRSLPPILCVPSSYCLTCPVDQREAVCFFKRTRQD